MFVIQLPRAAEYNHLIQHLDYGLESIVQSGCSHMERPFSFTGSSPCFINSSQAEAFKA